MIMFSGKVTFWSFFVWFTVSKSPVCRVKVTGLPYRNRRRFAVSKSPPVCRVKVAGLPYRNRRRFTVSKSPVCRFEVAESPVCRVEVTGENEIKSDENKKSICKLDQISK